MSTLVDELQHNHVRLGDGTRGGHALRALVLASFAVAAASVMAWSWFPSVEDGEIRLAVVVASLAVTSAVFAGLGWHAWGASTWRPLIGVSLVALVDLVLAALASGIAERIRLARSLLSFSPSLYLHEADWSGRFIVAAVAAAAGTAVFVVSVALRRRWARPLAALTAGFAPAVLIVLLVSSDRPLVRVPVANVDQLHAAVPDLDPAAISVSATAALATNVATLAGLLSMVCFGILGALGVRELIESRTRVGRQMIGIGLPVRRSSVIAVSAVCIALFALGRSGHLPGGAEILPAFNKRGWFSWSAAAVLAVAGVALLRRTERAPLQRRGVLGSLVVVGAGLTAGTIVLFVSNLTSYVLGPFLGGGSIADFVYRTLPSWSLWAQDWSNLAVPLLAGLAGVALLVRGERSDRSTFLVAVACLGVVPGALYALDHRHVGWLAGTGPATPDQVLLLAVAVVGTRALLGRPAVRTSRAVRLGVGTLLITIVAALIGHALGNRFFQLALILPWVFKLAFGSRSVRDKPPRGMLAVSVATGLLIVATAGLMTGLLNGDRVHVSDELAFLLLAAPLLLVEVAAEAGPDDDAEEPRLAARSAPRLLLVAPVLAAGALSLAALVIIRSPPPTRAHPIDVELVDRWTWVPAPHEGGGEVVQLQSDSAVIMAVSGAIPGTRCDAGLLGRLEIDADDPGFRPADPISGMDAEQLASSGLDVVCAHRRRGSTEDKIIVVSIGARDASVDDQLDRIRFAEG